MLPLSARDILFGKVFAVVLWQAGMMIVLVVPLAAGLAVTDRLLTVDLVESYVQDLLIRGDDSVADRHPGRADLRRNPDQRIRLLHVLGSGADPHPKTGTPVCEEDERFYGDYHRRTDLFSCFQWI